VAAWAAFGGLVLCAGARRLTLASRVGHALPDDSNDCWVDAFAVRLVIAPRFI
jgi:hypothetical protein